MYPGRAWFAVLSWDIICNSVAFSVAVMLYSPLSFITAYYDIQFHTTLCWVLYWKEEGWKMTWRIHKVAMSTLFKKAKGLSLSSIQSIFMVLYMGKAGSTVSSSILATLAILFSHFYLLGENRKAWKPGCPGLRTAFSRLPSDSWTSFTLLD